MGSPMLGVAGYGLLLAPQSPCVLARESDDSLWISSTDGLVTIVPGAGPATTKPPSLAVREISFPGGPLLRADKGGSLATVLVDVSPASFGPWTLLAPRMFLDLPVGLAVFSGDADNPMPEMHLRHADLNDASTIRNAFITFELRAVELAEVKLRGMFDVTESTMEIEHGPVRVFAYGYEHDGIDWRKRHYGVTVVAGVTLMMTAQAPQSDADRMFALADTLIASYSPLTG
ncbi:hypothetical protein BH11MYX2_BH11MYX2_12180 [soil metagenome]